MASGQLSKVLQNIRQMIGGAPAADFSDRQLLERFAEERDEEAFTEP